MWIKQVLTTVVTRCKSEYEADAKKWWKPATADVIRTGAGPEITLLFCKSIFLK